VVVLQQLAMLGLILGFGTIQGFQQTQSCNNSTKLSLALGERVHPKQVGKGTSHVLDTDSKRLLGNV